MRPRTPYGTIRSDFWDGDVGTVLQRAGAAPLILFVYLLSNRHANLLGLYRLPVNQVALELRILSREHIRAALGVLEQLQLAFYDEETQFVWVKEMAGLRLHPASPDQVIADDDKRLLGVWRAYKELPTNPFLAPFFDQYHARFRMPSTMRRSTPSSFRSPLASPFLSPFARSVDQGTEEQGNSEQEIRPVETAESVDARSTAPSEEGTATDGATTLSHRFHRHPSSQNENVEGSERRPLPFGPMRVQPKPSAADREAAITELAAVVEQQLFPLQPFASVGEVIEVTLAYVATDPRLSRDVVPEAVQCALERLASAGNQKARAVLIQVTAARATGQERA